MTKNQKIALGCGAAGCLGLIVLVIVAVAGFYFYNAGRLKTNPTNRNSSVDTNFNANSNSSDRVDNENSDSSDSTNSSSPDSSDSSSAMSNDDRHKLFQAASMTGDPDLVHRVSIKIGLLKQDGTSGPIADTFPTDHGTWAANNLAFIQSISTPAKAREYVDAHIND